MQISDTKNYDYQARHIGFSEPRICDVLYDHNKGFFTIDGWVSEEETIFFAIEESKHKLPEFTNKYLIQNFPGAKKFIKEKMKKEISDARRDLKEAIEIEKELEDIMYRKSNKENEDFMRMMLWWEHIDPLREGRDKIIRDNEWLLSTMEKGHKGEPLNIERAKQFPITELIEFNAGIARCIYHNEKTASLNYYPKENRVYCFGCNKHADAIDVYQKLNNCDFKTAVQKLQ